MQQTIVRTSKRPSLKALKQQWLEQAECVQAARNHPELYSRVTLLRLEAHARMIQAERRWADLGLDILERMDALPFEEGQGQS